MELALTPSVRSAQAKYFGTARPAPAPAGPDALTADEADFIAKRDSFYLSTVSEAGWPYIQHRGGAPGFLRVLNAHTLGFADLAGNRQMLSTGNLSANDRVALFLMDYPNRARLKILGHARVVDAREEPELARHFAAPGSGGLVERLYVIDVVGFDWNCPKYITPRFTSAEVEEAVAPLKARIAELAAQVRAGK